MKRFLLLWIAFVPAVFAVPLVYNNNAWYSGHDPSLVGKRENFLIQGVSVDAIKDANGFTGEFQAILRFNYGGSTPAIGSLSTISPYDFSSGGVVSSIQASDLFFRQSGVLQYGIPLVDHGGNAVNGNSMGNGVFDDGDLYKIGSGVNVMTSNQFMRSGTDPANFGSGRSVRLTSDVLNPQALQSGSTQIFFNGLCTESGCAVAEYTVTFNMMGAATQGSDWRNFLLGISNGSITPYFTGSACGNDLLDGAIPEPSTYLLLGGGLALMAIRARRNKL